MLAERSHRRKDKLGEEAMNHLLAYNDWFERKVKASLAAVERGETIADADVRAWIGQRERCGPRGEPSKDSCNTNSSGEPSAEDREKN